MYILSLFTPLSYFQSLKQDLPVKNKRTMGHIAQLRNQFKSMNISKRSSDYIYYNLGTVVQEKIFKLHECIFAVVLEKIFKISSMSICYFKLSPLGKGGGGFI